MGHIQTLQELLSMIRRHLWIILAVFLGGTALAAIYAKTRPDVYEATAVIQVETSEVSRPSASGSQGGGGDVAVLLQTIEQRLTARDALVGLMDRQKLFDDVPLPVDEKVALLRQSIRFQPIFSVAPPGGGQQSSLSALAVTVGLEDPELAARVANDIAQSILDRWWSNQMARTKTALDFYRADEARLWAEITRLDDEIAAFKNLNPSSLPEQAMVLNQELLRLDDQSRVLDQQRLAAQAGLDRIAQSGSTRTTDEREKASLQGDLDRIGRQQEALSARVAEIQSDLSRMPEVEKALDAYDRRRQQLEGQHTAVTTRLAEAETEMRLAESQQSDRVMMLERALTPPYPVGSGGKKTAIAGALGSLILALGLAFLLDHLHPVLRTAAQVERETGLRPLMVLPVVPTGKPAMRKARRAAELRQRLADTVAETPRATLALLTGAGLLFLASALVI